MHPRTYSRCASWRTQEYKRLGIDICYVSKAIVVYPARRAFCSRLHCSVPCSCNMRNSSAGTQKVNNETRREIWELEKELAGVYTLTCMDRSAPILLAVALTAGDVQRRMRMIRTQHVCRD